MIKCISFIRQINRDDGSSGVSEPLTLSSDDVVNHNNQDMNLNTWFAFSSVGTYISVLVCTPEMIGPVDVLQ